MSKVEFNKRVGECKKCKQELNDYVQKLNNKFKTREIDYPAYFAKYHEVTREKSVSAWNEYYDKEIKECEEQMNKLDREKMIAKIGLFILLSYIIISLGVNQLDLQTPTSMTIYDAAKHLIPLNNTEQHSLSYTIYDIIKKQ